MNKFTMAKIIIVFSSLSYLSISFLRNLAKPITVNPLFASISHIERPSPFEAPVTR